MKEGKNLRQLGSDTIYLYDNPSSAILETFENKKPEKDYTILLAFPEFTSLCPRTGHPDFATIEIRYIPDKLCIESKSLKLYFFAFRSHGSFMESIINKILDDCSSVCNPRWMEVKGFFNPRGGIAIDVTATFSKKEI